MQGEVACNGYDAQKMLCNWHGFMFKERWMSPDDEDSIWLLGQHRGNCRAICKHQLRIGWSWISFLPTRLTCLSCRAGYAQLSLASPFSQNQNIISSHSLPSSTTELLAPVFSLFSLWTYRWSCWWHIRLTRPWSFASARDKRKSLQGQHSCGTKRILIVAHLVVFYGQHRHSTVVTLLGRCKRL